MPRKIRHVMTPAQEKRRHQALLRQETVLEEEQRIVAALMHLISNGGLDKAAPRMTGRQIQVLFEDEGEQAISAQAMGRVLTKIGVQRDRSGWVQPRQIVDAMDRLNALADWLREALRRCREDLGR